MYALEDINDSNNTADGFAALEFFATGTNNTAVGYFALQGLEHGQNVPLSTGSNNTAVGSQALTGDYSGSGNTADGASALFNNSTGNNNCAVGLNALILNSSGSQNTALGAGALQVSTTGASNTALGTNALAKNTTGKNNIAIGYNAGINVISGQNNIDIGSPASTQNDFNVIHLGTQGTQQRTYVAGVFGATVYGGAPVYANNLGQLGMLPSSAKFKKNIHNMGSVSDALLALRPVTFQYKPEIDPTGTPQFGLVAEEVAKVDPDLVVHDANDKIYTVRYEAVNAMLLNEFQKETSDHHGSGKDNCRATEIAARPRRAGRGAREKVMVQIRCNGGL